MAKNYRRPDHKNLIFDHMERCSKIVSGDLENTDISSVEKYFVRVRMTLIALKGLVAPLIDNEFDEPQIEQGASIEEQVNYVEDFLTEVTQLLNRANIVYYQYNEPTFGVSKDETD